MTNQQLLDFIKQQLQQGISREQIKNSLMANGWQVQGIEEGFNSLDSPVSPEQYQVTSVSSSAKIWKILAGVLAGIVILGGGAYFASKTFLKSEVPPKISNEIIFADKLSSCTKYKTTFKHPLTGETLEKEILGIVNGKCDYVEQMPNGGKMECKYSESERMTVAQYYKDVATAESAGVSVNVNLGSGEQKTTYTINGKVVDNPLQEATNSGVCVISGY